MLQLQVALLPLVYTIIPNKHTEKVKSDEKEPGKKLGIANCN